MSEVISSMAATGVPVRQSGDLISCDWGTTALRLHLIPRDADAAVASVASDRGVATMYREWTAQPRPPQEREDFYLAALVPLVKQLGTAVGRDLAHCPMVISGMASATIGLRELPYAELPFRVIGTDLRVARMAATKVFPHPAVLVSGARTASDVMRGEETQLVGAARLDPSLAQRVLAILPGTHSKHVEVRDGRAVTLKTYMTGEFFELLSRRSVLANSVGEPAACPADEASAAFDAGVREGKRSNLLNAAFAVRVADLSGIRGRAANMHYLSGLLIGAELKDAGPRDAVVVLIGSATLTRRYADALSVLDWSGPVRMVSAEAAVVAGHRALAQATDLFNHR